MAIRILLDHGVPQEKIVFISLIATPQGKIFYLFLTFEFLITFFFFSGLHSIAYAFPKVKIVVTEVDKGLNDLFHIIPGIGNFFFFQNSFFFVIFFLKKTNKINQKVILGIDFMELIIVNMKI